MNNDGWCLSCGGHLDHVTEPYFEPHIFVCADCGRRVTALAYVRAQLQRGTYRMVGDKLDVLSSAREPDRNVIHDVLRSVQRGNESGIDVARELLPDGKERTQIALIHRELQPEPKPLPVLNRTPPAAHILHDADAVVAYVSKFGGPNSVVFVDVTDPSMTVVLDETVPQGGRTILTMRPAFDERFQQWAELHHDAPAVTDFARFALRHRTEIAAGTELASTLSQLRVARTIESWHGQGNKSVNGMRITVAIEGKETPVFPSLPDQITVNVPVLAGQEKRPLPVLLTIDGCGHDVPRMLVTIDNFAGIIAEAFAEEVKIVHDTAPEGTTIVNGAFDEGSWGCI